jgi:hypothetical protein
MRKTLSVAAILLLAAPASAAPAAPKGPHPRLFLGSATLGALKAKAASPSAAANAIALCKKVASNPADYQKSGYQGDNWAFPLSACALAYQLTGDAAHAGAGIKLWRAVLEDVETMGDKKACVAGASDTQAIAAIKRDTGYAIRFIGPHAALAYDWLHDAPGVDDGLRAQSRACFRAWIDYYTKSGYLNDVPGANYHAGYVAAKTFISVAEAGEDGANSDKMWTETVDDIFGKQLIGKGLAPTGALSGGDWAEGWQYGPLSVLEYALSARALEEQGVALPAMHQWATDLTLRFVYGLLPSRDASYVGGDTSSETVYVEPNGRVLVSTLAGPGSDQAASWAAFLRANVAKDKDDSPVLDALGEARAVTPVDPATAKLPLWYLAKGTRNVYARSSFAKDALFAVFTSAPRVVPDHQHMDASNFVLSRGGDQLIVDPSPYGSRSSLTGNAVTVDSLISNSEYRPSQTAWSEADLPWARGTQSGVVAARSDFAKAFIFSDKPSDVPFARRDWVFLPEGEIVAIDRTRTDVASRMTHVRFRSLAKLALSGNVAKGALGSSQVVIHQVKVSGGTAQTKSYPAVDNCDTGPFGACTNARVPVDEYSIDIPGPSALAIHAIDALGASESPADVGSIDDAPENDGVVGAAVHRGKNMTFVVASSAKDGAPGSTMTYGTPGDLSARHVVFDAPEDASGKSAVSVAANGGRCVVTITPGGSFAGRPLMFSVSSAADGCKASDDPDAPPASAGPGDTTVPPPPAGGDAADASSPTTGGCGCMMPRPRTALASSLFGFLAVGLSWARKNGRKRKDHS